MVFATVKPYGPGEWQAVAVRATEAAARKLKLPVGGMLIRARFDVKPRGLFTTRASYDVLESWQPNPGRRMKRKPAAKRKPVAKRKPAAKRAARRPATNPPRAGVVLSRRVLRVYYVHAGDGKSYVHEFAPGVTMEALGDREVRLFRPDGRAVSQNF